VNFFLDEERKKLKVNLLRTQVLLGSRWKALSADKRPTVQVEQSINSHEPNKENGAVQGNTTSNSFMFYHIFPPILILKHKHRK